MQEFLENLDLIVELFSFITAALIAGGSFYAYTKTHKPRHAAFGVAFLFIAAGAFLSTIFNYLIDLEVITIPLRGYLSISLPLGILLLLSMLFIILGYITIFIITEEITNVKVISLLTLLAPLGVWAAHEFYLFYHAILFTILALVFSYYAKMHSARPASNTLRIAAAFGTLAFSEIVFLFSTFDPLFYVAGHAVRVIAFAVLFWALVSIYRSAYNRPRPARKQRV